MVKQLSVMVENSSGSLYPVLRALADENIDIQALTIADTERYGILRIIVDQTEKAMDTLKRNGYVAKVTDIVCITMKDKAGAFSEILKLLEDNSVGLEYVYVLGRTGDGNVRILLRADDNENAENLLAANGYRLAGEE